MTERLDVVAAIVRNPQGEILLSQRPAHKHQGGRWEFPGGKVEAGESLHAALARELHEELGIDVQHSIPFMTIDHVYPELTVRLYFREVTDWSGMPHGREQQPVDWFALSQLSSLSFPEANTPVVTALMLPDRWLVLEDASPDLALPEQLRGKNIGGVYLRGVTQADETTKAFVARCTELGVSTLVRNDAPLAQQLGASGVHLSEACAAQCNVRPSCALLSVACHSDAALQQAARLNADMVMLSPVQATQTHPDAKPLGWENFAQLATGRAFAVYALGGLHPDDLARAREAGARGIAGIRAFMPAVDQ